MKLAIPSLLILAIWNLIKCYDILAKNILIEIDPDTNTAKVIETIEYQFVNDTFAKVEKQIPSMGLKIGNISVSSNNQNVDKYTVDEEDNGDKVIIVYVNKLKEIKKLNLEFIYNIFNVLNNSVTDLQISNKDSDKDITAHIDLTIKKLYESLTPEKVITNNSNETSNRVENYSQTNESYYSYVVPAMRRNFMKYRKIRNKYHFNLLLTGKEKTHLTLRLKNDLVFANNKNTSLVLKPVGKGTLPKIIYDPNEIAETIVAMMVIIVVVCGLGLLTRKD